jgi:hypothetical protein
MGKSMKDSSKSSSRWLAARRDLGLLLVLVLVCGALRTWQLTHTEVAARDSIGYIRTAWQFREAPWTNVINGAEQHPGYALALLAVSYPVRWFVHATDAVTMQLSAQLCSALAGILLVVPTYYLGRALFNRSVGFGAALLFQFLPTSSRILADGLSEGTFLLCAAAGLLFATLALRRDSNVLFGLTGLAGGLAYLTRPEGVLVVLATGMVLLGMQIRRDWRRSWLEVAACGACLLGGWLLIGAPFMTAAGGRFTVKNTGVQIMEAKFKSAAPMPPDQKERLAPVDGSPEIITKTLQKENRLVWGARKLGAELLKGFFFVTWIPALMGLWWHRRRLRRVAGMWVLLLVGAGMLALLYRVASYMRYISDRHTLLLIYCSCFWAAAGMRTLGLRLADLARRWTGAQESVLGAQSVRPRWINDGLYCSGLLLACLCAATLYKNLEPLHANRGGFRTAGEWLAEHAAPGDEIVDPYCWSHYYAGRVFLEEEKRSDLPASQAPTCYVVLEESGNEHPRLQSVPEAKKLAATGQKVFECKARRHREVCDVCIYAIPAAPHP